MEISVFLFVSIVPSSLIDYHWEEFGFWFWLPNIWYFHTFMRFFLHFLLFGLSSDDSSVAFVMKDVPVTQSSLWFFVGLVPVCPCLFYWGGQNWTQNSDGVSPVVRGCHQYWEEESLPCTCCLHRCWVTAGCCWPSLSQVYLACLCSAFCPSRTPGPFLNFPTGWLQHVLVHWVTPL